MLKRALLALVDDVTSRIGTGLKFKLDAYLQSSFHTEVAALKAHIGNEMPENPARHGFKVYSQNDEDGIIQAMLARIPASRLTGTFIEIGCGNGLENNTHALVLCGYRGNWIDGSAENIDYIRARVPSLSIASCRLKVEQQFVDLENIEAILRSASEHLKTTEPDFYSLDIDGNDLDVLKKSLGVVNPKILCVEYNPKFPPPIRVSIEYSKSFRWMGDDYQGASLQTFCDALTGYSLVCCNLAGCNAFFVRNDLAEHFELYSPKQLYQPARMYLNMLKSGHASTLKWLEYSLRR